MNHSYIGLGSNMGNSEELLQQACACIDAEQGLTVEATSPMYYTEPQGIRDQQWFVNQVIRVSCEKPWSASMLLDFLLRVEKQLGRKRSPSYSLKQGPRSIDLDLLLFGKQKNESLFLTLPHPRMFERAFVLIPLRHVLDEIAMYDVLVKLESSLAALSYRLEGQNIYQSA